MEQRDNDDTDTFEPLAAATARALEKHDPRNQHHPDEDERGRERSECKPERRDIGIVGIDRALGASELKDV